MTHNFQNGEANTRSKFDEATIRELRLRHLEGASCSELAKGYGVSCGQVSRIVRWTSWGHTDLDLRGKPRPVHKGGGSLPGPRKALAEDRLEALGMSIRRWREMPKRDCSECVHFAYESCTLGFPECSFSRGRAATLCAAFVEDKR